jgi:hypothetical protein
VRFVPMLLQSTINKYTYISWFINLPQPNKIHNLLHRWRSGVKNFKCMCSGFVAVSVVWSVSFHGSVVVCNLWIGPGFILEPCI